MSTINWDYYPNLKDYSAPLKPMTRTLIGRESLINSIMAAFSRPELCNVILLAPAGSGKALSDDEMIAVGDERGYVRMGDIKVGDEVFDETGTPTKVLGVYPQGLKRAYRVTFSNGSSIICNDEHLWTVRDRKAHKKGRTYQTMTLAEMMAKGIRHQTVKRGGSVLSEKMWYVPRSGAVKRPKKEVSVDPYVFGVFATFGEFAHSDDYLHIKSNDIYIADRIATELIAEGLKVRAVDENYCYFFESADENEARNIRVSEVFPSYMFDEEDTLKYAYRFIRELYLNGDIEQRMALLHGLMDMNGRISDDGNANISIPTGNGQFAFVVQQLASSLGFVTSVKRAYWDWYEVFFDVSDAHKQALFSSPYQLDRLNKALCERKTVNNKDRFDDLGISSVVDLGYDVPMTCIYVDARSHLFQAGYSHIVTHNTALVQGTMEQDTRRLYLEVDLAHMIADCQHDINEIAAKLKLLFADTEACVKNEKQEIVLFMDEFHQVVQLSSAAVEALKPLLADSGTRGIRVIAATTMDEFNQFISPNQPLVERLLRINVPEPDEDSTVAILKDMAKTYGVEHEFYDDHMFHTIYDYTNRHIPANSQPRKSIKVLDAMVGWYRSHHRALDERLLADVFQESEDVNVAFHVDATTIKQRLDAKVLSQGYASMMIEQRLHICVSGLNDQTKPMSSFLFTGSTGVGKTEMAKQLAEILFDDQRRLLRFDMTEYASSSSDERFRDLLTTRIWEHPYSILLLDEIEKAHAKVVRLMLQVLDDGRLVNRNNRVVSFANCYIIMTTNAGSEIYSDIATHLEASKEEDILFIAKSYNNLIRRSLMRTSEDNKFPPELIGRIDCIVMFQPLARDTKENIAKMKLKALKKKVRERHGVKLTFDDRIIKYLVIENTTIDSDAGGARMLVKTIETEVVSAVSRFINHHPDIKSLYVKVSGEMASEDKNRLESKAYIEVIPMAQATSREAMVKTKFTQTKPKAFSNSYLRKQ